MGRFFQTGILIMFGCVVVGAERGHDGEVCPDATCSVLENGICFQGQCRCKMSFYDIGDGFCTERIKANGSCTLNPAIPYQCNQFPNATCLNVTEGNQQKSICRCEPDSYYATAVNGSCEKRIRAGVFCNASNNDPKQCVENAFCSPNTSSCLCDHTFYNNGGLCNKSISVGKDCNTVTPEINQCVDNAFCNNTTGMCDCNKGYYQHSETICVQGKPLNATCNESAVEKIHQCSDPKAYCQNVTNRNEKICVCENEYYNGGDGNCYLHCKEFGDSTICSCKLHFFFHEGNCMSVTTSASPSTASGETLPSKGPSTVLPPVRLEDLIG